MFGSQVSNRRLYLASPEISKTAIRTRFQQKFRIIYDKQIYKNHYTIIKQYAFENLHLFMHNGAYKES